MPALNDLEYNKFDTSGNIKIAAGLTIPQHDYISVAYPNGTTEVYTYKTGGASGATVSTVTVVYTTTAKELLSTVTKT